MGDKRKTTHNQANSVSASSSHLNLQYRNQQSTLLMHTKKSYILGCFTRNQTTKSGTEGVDQTSTKQPSGFKTLYSKKINKQQSALLSTATVQTKATLQNLWLSFHILANLRRKHGSSWPLSYFNLFYSYLEETAPGFREKNKPRALPQTRASQVSSRSVHATVPSFLQAIYKPFAYHIFPTVAPSKYSLPFWDYVYIASVTGSYPAST